MHCMKCGRKVENSRSFCPDCMEEMEKYPVKPGTVVKLPDHPVEAPVKKRKRIPKPEEVISALRRSRRRLLLLLILSLMGLLAVSLFALYLLEKQNFAGVTDLLGVVPAILP